MSSSSDSDTNSQASHEATSGEPTLEMYEDLSQELEDFIYLWRLGCIDEALKLYKSRLQEHQYKHFPILVEFVDALLDQGQGRAIWNILSEDSTKHFDQPAQRAMLTLMRGINTAGIKPTLRSGIERSLNDLDIPIFVELSTIESLLIGVTEDKFDSVTYHLHELVLWTTILNTRLSSGDRKLLAPFYKRCCTILIGISKYWEAFRLIRIINPQLTPSSRLSCFKLFLEQTKRESYHTAEESNQPAKIAYLAGLIEYLQCVDDMQDFLDEAVDDGVLKPQVCINEASLLLEHFFGKLGNAKSAESLLFRVLTSHCDPDGNEIDPNGPVILLRDGGGWGVELTESEQQSLRDLYPAEDKKLSENEDYWDLEEERDYARYSRPERRSSRTLVREPRISEQTLVSEIRQPVGEKEIGLRQARQLPFATDMVPKRVPTWDEPRIVVERRPLRRMSQF